MRRREAIIRLAVLLGGSLVGPRLFAAALDPEKPASTYGFTPDEIALLDELGDTILPATDTPGAKAVQIGAFIAMMVHDCSPPDEQAIFKTGLAKIADEYHTRHGHSFTAGEPGLRTAFLNEIDRTQKATRDSTEPSLVAFRLLKELTILGYFTSESGATEALRYVETPGYYDGDVPYQKGDKAWATP
jgi:hypothetical protein